MQLGRVFVVYTGHSDINSIIVESDFIVVQVLHLKWVQSKSEFSKHLFALGSVFLGTEEYKLSAWLYIWVTGLC